MLSASSFLFDSNKKKEKSNSKRKLLYLSLKDLIGNDNNENKNIDDEITSLSIPSEKEDYLNLYKIPNTKIINDISSIESNLEKLNGNNKMKESKNQKRNEIEKKIIKVIYTKQKDNKENKMTMISKLNKEFSISNKDNLNGKSNLEKNSVDKFKKQQINLKKKKEQNLKNFIKTNQEKKNINDNLNNNKINKIKKNFDNNKKAKCQRKLKNINHILTDIPNIPSIYYKIEKINKSVEKSNINNKIIPSIFSIKDGNYKKNINTKTIFFKKSKRFTQIKLGKQIKNKDNQQDIKSKNGNFPKTNEISILNNSIESFNNIKSFNNKTINKNFSLNKTSSRKRKKEINYF